VDDLQTALDGDLRTVVELASLAPSVHNTQPWRFTWDGAALTLHEDPERSLPVLDPIGRERRISCGSAVLMARLAFAGLGYSVEAELHPWTATDPYRLATLRVTGRAQPSEADSALAQAIPRRTTDRDPFDARPLPTELLTALRSAAEQEGASLHVLGEESEATTVELQVLLSHADDSQRADPAYLEELARWRRDREAEGIPARALPSVPAELRGSSWTLRDFAAAEPHAVDLPTEPPPPEHPTVVVLLTDGDGPDDWLAAGQALARVLLRATVDFVAAQPLTQVLEVPVLRARMRHVLGGVGHPQMLLRLGYGHAGPTSRRRPPEQTVTLVEPAG
jgi:hypothetical protein